MKNKNTVSERFGTILGYSYGNVPVYSSDYQTVPEGQYPSRKSFRSYYDGIYMGYKWQCVEFSRRWMYINLGYIFDDVTMAYDIFDLRTVRDVKNKSLLPFNAFANGSLRHPEFGSLLIWQAGGEFEETGHVAVVVEVGDSYLRIAEQNLHHESWQGRNYSRELSAKIGENGEYWVQCSFGDAQILGWMMQTDDARYAEPSTTSDASLRNIISCHGDASQAHGRSWLNIANPDEEAFVKAMGGHQLTCNNDDKTRYFLICDSAMEQLEIATNELHGMFMHATDYVLEHGELLRQFNFPKEILPKIRQSWDHRLNEIITSRFDFSMTKEGIKVYEYNCDSASCYLEAAKIQGKWAHQYRVNEGFDAGKELFKRLVKAWKKCKAQGLVHILRDNDPEEKYHSLFMQEVIQAAGLRCKIITDFNALARDSHGRIIDSDAEVISWVWKTWSWETALDQIRTRQKQAGQAVELCDVLLDKDIMVFEPLWSLIPSNKAILPVLWRLFPGHPLLLNASFTLTDDLKAKGYVKKPIVGRCGSNITVINEQNTLQSQTQGQFAAQKVIYQEYFPLPKVDGLYTQICTFTAAGVYAGAGVRVDKNLIINKDSDCLALRVINDQVLLQVKS